MAEPALTETADDVLRQADALRAQPPACSARSRHLRLDSFEHPLRPPTVSTQPVSGPARSFRGTRAAALTRCGIGDHQARIPSPH